MTKAKISKKNKWAAERVKKNCLDDSLIKNL